MWKFWLWKWTSGVWVKLWPVTCWLWALFHLASSHLLHSFFHFSFSPFTLALHFVTLTPHFSTSSHPSRLLSCRKGTPAFRSFFPKGRFMALTRHIFHSMHYVIIIWPGIVRCLICFINCFLFVGWIYAGGGIFCTETIHYTHFVTLRSVVLKSIRYVCLYTVNFKWYHGNVLCTL